MSAEFYSVAIIESRTLLGPSSGIVTMVNTGNIDWKGTLVRTLSLGIREQFPASICWTLVAKWEHWSLWMDASNRLPVKRWRMAQARTSIQVSWGCKAVIWEGAAKPESNWIPRYWHYSGAVCVAYKCAQFIPGLFFSFRTSLHWLIYQLFTDSKWVKAQGDQCANISRLVKQQQQ